MKHLGEGEYADVLTVLLEFLRSYAPNDAYIRVEAWDPDWTDERHERCREEATVEDCLGCSDDGCPYHEDRYQRCFDDKRDGDLQDCICCRDCHLCDEAERLCREDAPLVDCIGCATTSCTYAGLDEDMTACREGGADGCPDCEVVECRYAGDDDGEEKT